MAQWETKRLKFKLQNQMTPERAELLQKAEEVSFLPMESIGEQGELDLSQVKSREKIGSGYTLIFDGDVVVAKITPCFENGKGALIQGLKNGVGYGTTELHVLTPGPDLDAKFLLYITQSLEFRTLGEGNMTGSAGQKRVPDSFIKNYSTPFPSLDEQQQIVAHLDRETARLDELRAEKERFLDLLERKRAALIAHAVTGRLT